MDPVPPGGWGTAGGAPDVHPTTGAGQEGQGAPVGGLDAGNAPQSSVYAEQNRANDAAVEADEDVVPEEEAEGSDDEEEYQEDEEEDDDDDDEEEYSLPEQGSKRKRGNSSTALDADLHMAQQLQEELAAAAGGGGSGRHRTSRGGGGISGLYNESNDDDPDYMEGQQGPGAAAQPPANPPPAPAPATAAGGSGGGMKLKIKLPNIGTIRGTTPPTTTYQQSAAALVAAAAAPKASAAASAGVSGASGASGRGKEKDEDEVQWLEWDDDETNDAVEEAAKKRRRMPHCLLTHEELSSMDDEVEKVLSHREIPGLAVNPKNLWASREFYVKWARYSYIHCSWDAYDTLKQLGGFKRVLNYCRKEDGIAAERSYLSAEEKEDADVRAEMEAELEREHSEIERIFGERLVTSEVAAAEDNHPAGAGGGGDGGGEDTAAAAAANDSDSGGDAAVIVQYLCKWRGLPYSEATWESFADVERIGGLPLVESFKARDETAMQPRRTVDAARRAFSTSGHRAFEKQPDYLQGGGELRDYQLAGLNWMAYSWARGINGILADEMGLGKTVQCASMVGYLSQVQNIGGPFLIIVPLSTVPNWAREFKKWIPQINAVVYVGDAPSREVIRAYEFPLPGPTSGRTFKCDALITTYELALKDAAILRNVKWSYLMVDEAHRLKNSDSALYRELSQWVFQSKLLVTGTPLQNNMKELWCLLHFLHPEKFPSAEDFEADHDPKDPLGVQRLHAALRPHLLRRVIKDVEKSLPPKNERILRVPMTPLQKQYYKWILTRNFSELNKSAKGSQVTLLNIIMDLKKCCNHPFLFDTARDNYNIPGGADPLVATSGKMVLLDKLLRRLKETGHRVLIFSQMVRVLDILSEYMTLRGYRHQRLDGSTPAHQRHQAMERFNAPDSPDFAFLLSTRAGGLGINLATADTVLLFDSDWNPQNDLQAMSRAHRIGQKDIVNIYRLVTSGSVEEDILERAKRKMVLDHVVIQRMDTSGRTVLDPKAAGGTAAARLFGKDELAAILKFGAGELFKEEEGAAAVATADGAAGGGEASGSAAAAGGGGGGGGGGLMTDEDLDAILARAEVVEQREEDVPGGPDDLLSSFNVATFKNDEDDAVFWNRLIPEHLRPKTEPVETNEPGIRAARLRTMEGGPINLNPPIDFRPKAKKPKVEPGPPLEGALLRIDRWPQAVDAEGRLVAGETDARPHGFPRTLSKKDANAFYRAVKRHGLLSKLDVISAEAGLTAVGQSNSKAMKALWHGLVRGCEAVVDLQTKRSFKLQQQGGAGVGGAGVGGAVGGGLSATPTPAASGDNTTSHTISGAAAGDYQHQQYGGGGAHAPAAAAHGGGGAMKVAGDAKLDFFGVEIRAADVLAFIRQMQLLEGKVGPFAAQPDAVRRLRLSMHERPAPTAWMRACGWTPEDDSALLVGVFRHGLGSWDKMHDDADLRLAPKLAGACSRGAATADVPKSSHLDTRASGILRQIEKVAMRPPKPPKGAVAGRGRGGPGIEKQSALRREPPSAAAVAAFKEVATRSEAALGQEACTLIRKLRTLQRRGNEMESGLVVTKTRKYIHGIGKRIEEVATSEYARAELWAYVSEFTENSNSGAKLQEMYSTHSNSGLVMKQLQQATEHSTLKQKQEEEEEDGDDDDGEEEEGGDNKHGGGVYVQQQQMVQQQQQGGYVLPAAVVVAAPVPMQIDTTAAAASAPVFQQQQQQQKQPHESLIVKLPVMPRRPQQQ